MSTAGASTHHGKHHGQLEIARHEAHADRVPQEERAEHERGRHLAPLTAADADHLFPVCRGARRQFTYP